VIPVARLALLDCLSSNFAQAIKTMAHAIVAPIIPMGVPRWIHQIKLHQGEHKVIGGNNKRYCCFVISFQQC